MNHATHTIMVERPPLGWFDKAAVLIACALGVVTFSTIGWSTMAPADPLGAVSASALSGGLMMIVRACLLAGVIGGSAALIAGRKLLDVGILATAVGLAWVSLRGATTGSLLIQYHDSAESAEQGLAVRFLLESAGWFAVMAAAMLSSAVVMRLLGQPTGYASRSYADGSLSPLQMGGYDMPRLSTRWFGITADQQTDVIDGLMYSIIAAGSGVTLIAALSTGLASRAIAHGQVCFVIAVGVCIATTIAFRIIPVRSALWPMLSVLLTAMAGYAWSALRPSIPGLPPNIPSSDFLRALPIQFMAVGVASALLTFWSMHTPPPREPAVALP